MLGRWRNNCNYRLAMCGDNKTTKSWRTHRMWVRLQLLGFTGPQLTPRRAISSAQSRKEKEKNTSRHRSTRGKRVLHFSSRAEYFLHSERVERRVHVCTVLNIIFSVWKFRVFKIALTSLPCPLHPLLLHQRRPPGHPRG